MKNEYEFFALHKDFKLAHALASSFGKQLHVVRVDRFADSEVRIVLPEDVALSGATAFIVHSTSAPVHDNFMQLALLVHLLKQHGARRVVAVVPYFGYSRQCEADDGTQGTAAVVARMLEAAGIDAVMTVEPHDKKLATLFTVPLHAVDLHAVIAKHARQNIPNIENCCLVAPDHGARERAHDIANLLGVPLVLFGKERYGIDKVRITGVEGSCSKDCAVLVDDIIDTGGTALSVANQLRDAGVKKLYGYFVHPVLSGDVVKRLHIGPFEKVFVAGTIQVPENAHDIVHEFAIVEALVNSLKEIHGTEN